MPPASHTERAAWGRELRRRLRLRPLVKGLMTTLGISAFFVAYFWVLQHPQSLPTLMPLTALDAQISFQPAAVVAYFSLWVYVALAPALLESDRELVSYGLAALAISGVGFGIFSLWPTAVPSAGIDWSAHPTIAFLKDVDLAANACPSMHVAFAVYTGVWLHDLLRAMHSGRALLALNALWCVLIVYSTVATRQHVVLDVLAGALLGAAVVALALACSGRHSGVAIHSAPAPRPPSH